MTRKYKILSMRLIMLVVISIIITIGGYGILDESVEPRSKIDLLKNSSSQEDVVAVVESYTQAAVAGDSDAALMLGFMLLPKGGKERRCHVSEYWFRQSAQSGNPLAALVLGIFYSLNPVISRGAGEIYLYWLLAGASEERDINGLANEIRRFMVQQPDDFMNEEKFRYKLQALVNEKADVESLSALLLWINELQEVDCVSA